MSDKPVCLAGIKKLPVGFTRHAGVARAVGHTARDNHSYVLSHGDDHCFLPPLTVLIFRCTVQQ